MLELMSHAARSAKTMQKKAKQQANCSKKEAHKIDSVIHRTLLNTSDGDDEEQRQNRRERRDWRQPRDQSDSHHEQEVKVRNSAELFKQIPR
jgi:hypothetical protein